MLNIPASFSAKTIALSAALLALTACSPQYNWRETSSDAASYTVALPDKPATFSRRIDLNGIPVSMTMIASEVGKTTFAVGSAELPDAKQAQVSLTAIKTALVKNIKGSIRQEKILTMAQSLNPDDGKLAVTEIEAFGPADAASDGQRRVLFARFVARDKHVYQLVATGPEKSLSRDLANTFFTSFKFN
jgi:hypothetical protein